MLVSAFLIAGTLFAQDAQVTLLMSKDHHLYPHPRGCKLHDAHPAIEHLIPIRVNIA
jgi:hypothetical protein